MCFDLAARVVGAGHAVHATAIAINARALVIRGRSKAGKSRLAATLIAASTDRMRIELVGDDRVLLRRTGDVWMARAHPAIAGFIERRGLGIVAMPFRQEAPVAAVVDLIEGKAGGPPLVGGCFPQLRLAEAMPVHEQCDRLLSWWRDLGASARHTDHSAD